MCYIVGITKKYVDYVDKNPTIFEDYRKDNPRNPLQEAPSVSLRRGIRGG